MVANQNKIIMKELDENKIFKLKYLNAPYKGNFMSAPASAHLKNKLLIYPVFVMAVLALLCVVHIIL
jgi:hypothetical protein